MKVLVKYEFCVWNSILKNQADELATAELLRYLSTVWQPWSERSFIMWNVLTELQKWFKLPDFTDWTMEATSLTQWNKPNKQTTGFDVHGSMHHSTIHTEKSNKMQQCIKIYYSIFIWSSTCFGRHTAHRQEPKTALTASGLHTWKAVWRVVAGCCQAENLWYSAW
jgi:hypothetical protein